MKSCRNVEYGYSSSFATATWSEIQAIANKNAAQTYFSVGDTKNITLDDSNVFNMRIDDFNKYGANIVLISTNLYPEKQRFYNASSIDVDRIIPWASSNLKGFVESTLYNLFPEEVKAVMKSCTRMDVANNTTFSAKLWIPNATELFGYIRNGIGYYKDAYMSDDESNYGFSKLSYYTIDERRTKTVGNTSTEEVYWTISNIDPSRMNNGDGDKITCSRTGEAWYDSVVQRHYVCVGFCV